MKRNGSRIMRTVLLAALFLSLVQCGYFKSQMLGIEKPKHLVRVERNVMVPMRDGVRLATDIYFPVGVDKAPAILVRTPYGKGNALFPGLNKTANLFARRGYVYIVQDVRGRFKSGGEFYPFVNDGRDGHDMIDWIESRDWYNGNLGTWGASYLGITQWMACPGEDLSAMHTTVTSPNLKEVIYTNGELHLMTIYFWAMMMGEREFDMSVAPKLPKIEKYMRHLPLGKADDNMARDVDYFNHSLDPQKIWELYETVNFDERYAEVSAPTVSVAGWYDMFVGPQLRDFERIMEEGRGAAKESVLIVGPWGHGESGHAVDFGDVKRDEMFGEKHLLDWYDHWLKGRDNGVDDWPRVRIFVMGDNEWREEDEWPLARTEYVDYYLHSDGNANTRDGDGTLSTFLPGNEPPDKFVYDPLDPVPTKGGNNLGLNLGAYDQQEIEDREDVLVYTTPVLEDDVEVTGYISAVLYAKTDAVDTDFTVKLVDVWPDGKAVNIQDGVVRAMYRNNDPENPTPLTPGEVERYELDLWATSNVFKKGHRIRVEVSSSNFPRFNRNLNTGVPPATATKAVKADQTVFHDAERPSRIVLPVIPR